MPDRQLMKGLGYRNYKYLEILEADKMRLGEMKVRVRKEYYRRIRKLLTSKLNGGNMIKAMNTWAAVAVHYTAGIVDWKVDELKTNHNK